MVAGQSCIAGPSVDSTVIPVYRPYSDPLSCHTVSHNTGAYSSCLLHAGQGPCVPSMLFCPSLSTVATPPTREPCSVLPLLPLHKPTPGPLAADHHSILHGMVSRCLMARI